jgi:hypothetical protein
MYLIRTGLGMRKTEIAREPSPTWNPHYYAIFAQVHNTLQPNHPVVGFKHHLAQLLHRSEADPLVAPTTQSGCLTRPVGDSFISAAEDEHLNDLVEDQFVRHSVTVTAERMDFHLPRR